MSPVWRVPVSGPVDGAEREVRELCRRALGGRGGEALAEETAEAALGVSPAGRLQLLAGALRECRRAGEDEPLVASLSPADDGSDRTLAEAVAAELEAANGALPGRQREALALRELLGLSHEETARVLGIDVSAVAAVLARARLALRKELRGATADPGCPERERALRALARRQDGEAGEPSEADWIQEHLAGCTDCERAHAAMLEASVCYRAWGLVA